MKRKQYGPKRSLGKVKKPQNETDALAAEGLGAMTRGEVQKAVDIFGRLVGLHPKNAAFHNNYGTALLRLGRHADAIREFETAIVLKPDFADPFVNLATAEIARLEEEAQKAHEAFSAEELRRRTTILKQVENALKEAQSLAGERLDVTSVYASLRFCQGRFDEGFDYLDRCEALAPASQNWRLRKAKVSAGKRMWERAAYEIADAPGINTTDRALLRGEYLARSGDFKRAREYFAQAAPGRRSEPLVRIKDLGFCPDYFDSSEEIDEYWHRLDARLDKALEAPFVCDWRDLPADGFIPPFQLAHFNRCCRSIKEKFARLFEPSCRSYRDNFLSNAKKEGKIRIGFLVTSGAEGGFLRSMSEIINGLDQQRFEPIMIYRPASAKSFADNPCPGKLELSSSFDRAVEQIRELECDALYFWKIGGDAWNYFLPMLRLAPVQITSWGAHGTSGVSEADYYISWNRAEIPTAQDHYTENLVMMREAPVCQRLREFQHAATRSELGLPETGALYYCPHRLAKYHPDFDLYLRDILELDPDGRILLSLGAPWDEPSEFVKNRILRKTGDTLGKRIVFINRLSPRLYDKVFHTATALLDSSVYSGCITMYDAFSHGVPCVSKEGDLLVQRYPSAAYGAMEIEDAPVARTREDYAAAAARIGREPDYREYLVNMISERRDRIFDRRQAVAEFGRLLEAICRQ